MPYTIENHNSVCPRCGGSNLLIGTVNKSFKCADCATYFMWPDSFRQLIWDLTKGKCIYCAVPMLTIAESKLPRFVNARTRFTIDHFYPRALGGTNTIDNLVPCCNRCNSWKKHMTAMEYLVYLRTKINAVHDPDLYRSSELTYQRYPDTIRPAMGDSE